MDKAIPGQRRRALVRYIISAPPPLALNGPLSSRAQVSSALYLCGRAGGRLNLSSDAGFRSISGCLHGSKKASEYNMRQVSFGYRIGHPSAPPSVP